jgi:hypothetical protein
MTDWLHELQSGIFRTMLLDDSLARLEASGIAVRGASGPPALAEVKVADFSPAIRHRATEMEQVYVAFFCLENAVRELIVQRLAEHHGADWWVQKVPNKIQEAVTKLREKEKKAKYHAQRADNDIGYTMFGQLSQIIISNWDDFSDLFPDQAWVTARFTDLEMSRNIIMHTNVLPSIEIDRIDSIVRDWLRQVG